LSDTEDAYPGGGQGQTSRTQGYKFILFFNIFLSSLSLKFILFYI
jgi:hypothetical protein